MAEGQRNGKLIQSDKLCHSCTRVMKGRLSESWFRDHAMHLGFNVISSSAQICRGMVNGNNTVAVNIIIILNLTSELNELVTFPHCAFL